MPESPIQPRDAARPRFRGIISTALMIMIAVLIVRDLLVRRWSSAPPPATDVTERYR